MNRYDRQHYVPVLRWKEAERFSLAQLDVDVSMHVTPLIELVPENFRQGDKRLPNETAMYYVAGHLSRCWETRPFYLDLLNLPSLQSENCLALLGSYAESFRLSLVPVTGLCRNSSYNTIVTNIAGKMKQGACLRLTSEDLRSANLDESVSNVLSLLDLRPREIDLLIDCEALDGKLPRFNDLCSQIPLVEEWRNFVVTGGAFPENLKAYTKNERHQIQRLEWTSWREQASRLSSDARLPVFSDYTIQYGRYSARRPGRIRFSANIRYTSGDYWVVMRGEDVFKEDGLGFKQYVDLAFMLCDLPEYYGESYSNGDRYIKKMSSQTVETGGATQWLQAGINHHMTCVVRQLAALNSN